MAMQAAASTLNLSLAPFEARSPKEFTGAFEGIAKTRCDSLLVQGDTLFAVNAARIAELALKYRLPSASALNEYAEVGGLITYGPDRLEGYRRAAVFVDRILKGAKVADLPIEQATSFKFVITMKTATSLGMSIPQSLQTGARLI
jgi:putative ABC transport system substrate-binding protein